MDIQYLSDSHGTITGVLLSLAEWQRLKQQYNIVEEPQPETGAKLRKGLTDALKKAGLDEGGTAG